MSLLCACLSRRRNSQAHMLFQEQFARLRGVFPGTSYACLLDGSTGDLIAQSEVAEVNTDELARTVLGLKSAAMRFALTLSQIDSQVVHIKGDGRLFSCYGFGHTILAFYTDMPGVELELFDCCEADKSVELINTELNRIVHATNGSRRI